MNLTSRIRNANTTHIRGRKIGGESIVLLAFSALSVFTFIMSLYYEDVVNPRGRIDHVKTVCVQEIYDMYAPLIDDIEVERLHFSLESQYMAELFVFSRLCMPGGTAASDADAEPLLMSVQDIESVFDATKMRVYLPMLPLLALRAWNRDVASAMSHGVFAIVDAMVSFHRHPDSFFVVCNHWAAPFLLRPFDFTDEAWESGNVSPILYTYESDYALEMRREEMIRFNKRTRPIPYVENSLVHGYTPLRRARRVYFAGSVVVNMQQEGERKATEIRKAFETLTSIDADIITLVDTTSMRKKHEDESRVETRCATDTEVTWTECNPGDFNRWESDVGHDIQVLGDAQRYMNGLVPVLQPTLHLHTSILQCP